MGDLEQSAIEQMTDKEIMQVLRYCSDPNPDACNYCQYLKEEHCILKMAGAALDLIERLNTENAALREKQRWIPVEDRLPKPEIDVLIVCNRNGYRFVTPAIYEDGKMLTQDSGWNWCDIDCYGLYDEDVDDYYIPEGWWENRQFNPDDVYNNPVDCTVTHWMPLPGAPEGDKHE